MTKYEDIATLSGVGSSEVLERCPNCGQRHSNAPNWYCNGCSERLQRYTGKGYADENGLRSNAAHEQTANNKQGD